MTRLLPILCLLTLLLSSSAEAQLPGRLGDRVQQAHDAVSDVADGDLRYAGWNTDATSYWIEETSERWNAEDGGTFTYRCEGTNLPGDLANKTYGDNPYTTGSRICVAGVHAGAIVASEGGNVTVEITLEGPITYPAVERHGVTTRSHNAEGAWVNYAFRVVLGD